MFKIINTVFIALLVFRNNIAKEGECPEPINICENDKISFYLYTQNVKEKPYKLILGDEKSIQEAPFIPETDIKFIIHGYAGSKDEPHVMVDLRKAYLEQNKFNILVVDWGPLAKYGCYFKTAFRSIKQVGECSAEMVKSIIKHRPKISANNFHIVAWSMGAHVAAHLANKLRPTLIKRITGLDPAFPKFDVISKRWHKLNILNKKHAKFVDVIHANMGIVGVYYSKAHYDIYLRRGGSQPGCKHWDLECEHRRAIEFFIETINTGLRFYAKKCAHWQVFVLFRICDGHSRKILEVGEHCLPPNTEEGREAGVYLLPDYRLPKRESTKTKSSAESQTSSSEEAISTMSSEAASSSTSSEAISSDEKTA